MLPHRETEQPIPIPLVTPTSRFSAEPTGLPANCADKELSPPDQDLAEGEYPFMEFSS